MVALDKTKFKEWIDRPDVVSVEQVVGWGSEIIVGAARNATFIPYLEGPRSSRFSINAGYDGSDEYTTFLSLALQTSVESLGSAEPNWKGIKNSVAGTVPLRYYDTTIT